MFGVVAVAVIAAMAGLGVVLARWGARGGSANSGLGDVVADAPQRHASRRLDDARYRVARLVTPVVCFAVLTTLRVYLFRHGRPPTWWWERLLVNASWAWTAAAPVVVIGAVSLGMARRRRRDDVGERISNFVCFRIVSRGRNLPAIIDTVEACRAAMAARPLFPYRIEVVVDQDIDLPEAFDLHVLRVPDEYRTPRGSKFKARALHYATQAIALPDHAWTFHLDEESRVTDGLIGGIRDAIVEEEARVAAGQTARIGQGAIVYTSNLREHPLLTLADSLRTGDDLTRFHTQFRSGRMFCGIHGSFILCRVSVENAVSFDVGPEGSITEDAWWAYEQAASGAGFRWIDGYLVEQSPESWLDFAKQRRRWYSGLWKVALYAPCRPVPRALLMTFLTGWFVSSIGGLYTFVNLFTGLATPPAAEVVGAVVFSWYLSTYLTGLWLALRSLPPGERPGVARRLALYVAQILVIPVLGGLEALGVFMALVDPETGFHVVKKSGSTGEGEADAGRADVRPAAAVAA